MGLLEKEVKTACTPVTVKELKQLLYHIVDTTACFRFRPIGGMWMKNLMTVTSIREDSVVLFDDKGSKYHLITLSDITQFEIGERFQNYQPYNHDDVQLSPEF